MNADDKEIVEMHLSEDDEGELHYTQNTLVRRKKSLSGWIVKVLGTALGVAAFLFFIVFFVSIVIPLVLVLILFFILKNIFRSRR